MRRPVSVRMRSGSEVYCPATMSRLRSRWGSRLIADPDPLDRFKVASRIQWRCASAPARASEPLRHPETPATGLAASVHGRAIGTVPLLILKGSGVLTARIDAIEQRASR